MCPRKDTQKSAKSTTAINKESTGFTDEERAAMKERAQEWMRDENETFQALCRKLVSWIEQRLRARPRPERGLRTRSPPRSRATVP